MGKNVSFQLPADRAAQLRAFADQHGTTAGGAIGLLFRALYQHTDAPCDIPSVEVNTLADGLVIRVEGNEVTGFGPTAVAQIVQTVRAFVAGEHMGEKIEHLCSTQGGTFAIWRKGNATKIAIPAAAPEKNFAIDLLEDFADILEHEIAKAKA